MILGRLECKGNNAAYVKRIMPGLVMCPLGLSISYMHRPPHKSWLKSTKRA